MGGARGDGGPGPHRRPGRGRTLTLAERRQRTADADALCTAAFTAAVDGTDPVGVALVAVGGYGRRELAPRSDLDVVLVHADGIEVGGTAGRIWYPLWDAGAPLDHSVRALSEVTAAAAADPRVALGLLDTRHLAGDTSVTLTVRAALLTQWRRNARTQLRALQELGAARERRLGELAHASVPDLKESTGGLRDATVLHALTATWLVDVPHTDLERCRLRLLDVRDALHDLTGRAGDRVAPELWGDLAHRLGLTDADDAQRQVRRLGRRITHLSRLTWRRVDAVLARPASTRGRAPDLRRVAPGVAVSAGEVVLTRDADPGADPLLLLRAAAEAAERDLPLSPATAARLGGEGPPLPEPWSRDARDLFTRLLGAGPGLLPVYETLDETGAVDLVLPEWERVRLLPHASPVHRFTVDRHLVETCVEASRLIRRVARPDVLLVAALLHDIGKGGHVPHSVAGEPVAAAVAERLGFEPEDVALVRRLVRWHLLLTQVATTRDLADPATIAEVAGKVADPELLGLLEVLTEADARATAPQAWTTWRSGLVADLVQRVRRALADEPGRVERDDRPGCVEIPAGVRTDRQRVDVRLEGTGDGARVTVVSGDRVGLMAAAAGALAVQRVNVRAVRAWTQDEYAVSVWDVAEGDLDPAILRQRVEAVDTGGVADPADRLRRFAADPLEPTVSLQEQASRHATVLEVRAGNRSTGSPSGVVYLVCAALASLRLSVRSAHVTTLGPQVIAVFYVQERDTGVLPDDRSAAAVDAVRVALRDAATL